MPGNGPIGQPHDNLTRRQTGIFQVVAQVEDCSAITAAQGIYRHGAQAGGAGIGW